MKKSNKIISAIDSLLSVSVSTIEEFLEVCSSLFKQYAKPVASLAVVVILWNKFVKNFVMYVLITFLLFSIYNFVATIIPSLISIPITIFYATSYILYKLGVSK